MKTLQKKKNNPNINRILEFISFVVVVLLSLVAIDPEAVFHIKRWRTNYERWNSNSNSMLMLMLMLFDIAFFRYPRSSPAATQQRTNQKNQVMTAHRGYAIAKL